MVETPVILEFHRHHGEQSGKLLHIQEELRKDLLCSIFRSKVCHAAYSMPC